MHIKAKFLTFEGIEGMGKSTLIKYLSEKLAEKNIPYCLTREPGGTAVGESIRAILLHEPNPICAMTELLLIFAARAAHLHDVIMPALARNQWVLCDRFIDATYAYQGAGRGMDEAHIALLEKLVLGDVQADYTFILDAPVEVGLKRIKKRGVLDRFEQEHISFFEKVRQSYLSRAHNHPERYQILDASLPLSVMKKNIYKVFKDVCPI